MTAQSKEKTQLTTLRGSRWWKEVGWKHIVGIAVIIYCVIPLLYVLSVSFIPNATLNSDISFSDGLTLDHFKALTSTACTGSGFLIHWWFQALRQLERFSWAQPQPTPSAVSVSEAVVEP